MSLTTITMKERTALNRSLMRFPILCGNDRTGTRGDALKAISNALDEHGFDLDMVTADVLMGIQGSRLLSFRRTHPLPFHEHPEISNAGISFTWEHLDHRSNALEIIAYVG